MTRISSQRSKKKHVLFLDEAYIVICDMHFLFHMNHTTVLGHADLWCARIQSAAEPIHRCILVLTYAAYPVMCSSFITKPRAFHDSSKHTFVYVEVIAYSLVLYFLSKFHYVCCQQRTTAKVQAGFRCIGRVLFRVHYRCKSGQNRWGITIVLTTSWRVAVLIANDK